MNLVTFIVCLCATIPSLSSTILCPRQTWMVSWTFGQLTVVMLTLGLPAAALCLHLAPMFMRQWWSNMTSSNLSLLMVKHMNHHHTMYSIQVIILTIPLILATLQVNQFTAIKQANKVAKNEQCPLGQTMAVPGSTGGCSWQCFHQSSELIRIRNLRGHCLTTMSNPCQSHFYTAEMGQLHVFPPADAYKSMCFVAPLARRVHTGVCCMLDISPDSCLVNPGC